MLKATMFSLFFFLCSAHVSYAQVNGITIEGATADFNGPEAQSQYFLATVGRTPNPFNSPLPTDWWSVINVRHRGGGSDGNLWGTQIAAGLTYHWDRMFFRGQVGGTWRPWNEICTASTPRVLINKATDDGNSALQVNGNAKMKGTVLATRVKVSVNPADWPDYVFHPEYVLPALPDVEHFIRQHHHLPEMPSANEAAAEGQDLGEMNRKLLKKVEELTLYLIDQQKQLNDQSRKQAEQQAEITRLRDLIKR